MRSFQRAAGSASRLCTWIGGVLLLALVSGCNSSSGSSSKKPDPEPEPPVRTTTEGDVRGVDEGAFLAFRGIPYAAPPVNELRFAPPQPPAKRDEVLDASEFGSLCPQAESPFGKASLDEDCLYLNIYTPKDEGDYPVMVWIHGGAFIFGSGSDEGYDPARLVAEGVVLVTLNYRLGALGFLAHADLSKERPEVGSGNYGLMDQQQALRWIQDNIENFGGDPNNVTIFGESAGGHSVLSHIASPAAEGLFHKAIVQSGSYNPGQMPLTLGEMLVGVPFVKELGCDEDTDVPACLREATVADLLKAQADSWYLPMTGGEILPKSIYEALDEGNFNKVPVLMGSNLHEGRLFVALDIANGTRYDSEEEYTNGVKILLLEDPTLDAAKIAADYLAKEEDPEDPNRFRQAIAAIQTDWRFNCGNLLQWNQLARHNVPTYGYWFVDETAPHPFVKEIDLLLPMGATHTLEIQYVFGTVGDRGGNEAQQKLSDAMVSYWTRFAKFGDPNSGAAPLWDPFATDKTVLRLHPAGTEASDAGEFSAAHNCNYWANPPKVAVGG